MTTLLIIDDELQARENLKSMLADCCPDTKVIGEADGVQSGILAIRELQPEVVMLDIQMHDGTGFDLLEQIPNHAFKLIFTTAYDDFALKAFRYNAIDYLLKPIDPDQLKEAVQKVQADAASPWTMQLSALFDALKGKSPEKLALPSQEGITYIKLNEILYLKSEGNYTLFYLLDGSRHIVTKALLEYETILPNDTFFRIHQSYMVHTSQVRRFVRDESIVLIHNGDRLPVAKRRRQEFLDWLNEK